MTERPEIAIARVLDADVQGLEIMHNMFVGLMRPPSHEIPHCCVFVSETGGPAPEAYNSSCDDTLFSTVQVMVRSDVDEYAEGKDLALAVWNACQKATVLDGAGAPKTPSFATVADESEYTSITCSQSSPIPLGRDDTDHFLWSINVDTTRSHDAKN